MLLVLTKVNTPYVEKGMELMTMSGSTSKTSALKSFQTFTQAETTPAPTRNEDPHKKHKKRHSREIPKLIVQTEWDSVLALSPDAQHFKSTTTNQPEPIFNVFLKYWFAQVELTWQSRVPSYCLNCPSELTMEEGIANKVSIRYFHCSLCHKCLLLIIWKLSWSPIVHWEDCYSHDALACTCYFGLPTAWARQQE